MFLCTKRQIPNNIALPISSEQLFQGLISPRAFTELLRLARPGGVIAWNIATGYEAYGPDYERYDEIVMGLVRDRRWEFLKPVKVGTYILHSEDIAQRGKRSQLMQFVVGRNAGVYLCSMDRTH